MPVTEPDLHAYVDGALPEERRTEVEAYLSGHSEDAERVAAWRRQAAALHGLYDPVLDEPVPERLMRRPRRAARIALRAAAIAASFVVGGVAGWLLRGLTADGPPPPHVAWVRQAAIAHATYTPEVRHAVEVPAEQEKHLVNWLSKRIGSPLKVPYLGADGYALVGGRMLPSESGPVAQFMYQDAKGQRLTLYVRANRSDARETAFRFAQENKVGVFYWIDDKLAYALSGEVGKQELLRVATTVYRQLNP